MSVLEVHNISKSFGSTEVLRDISFTLDEGQSLAILWIRHSASQSPSSAT
ncbi:MAG: hypothetical protein LUE15_02105 [Oscillospiraceae bacterium]|nr:hypothetical protein [Oscillospiraceae bacterium]